MKVLRCACCGNDFEQAPGRKQQSVCLSPCTAKHLIEKREREEAALQVLRDKSAQQQFKGMSALQRRLLRTI